MFSDSMILRPRVSVSLIRYGKGEVRRLQLISIPMTPWAGRWFSASVTRQVGYGVHRIKRRVRIIWQVASRRKSILRDIQLPTPTMPPDAPAVLAAILVMA